MDPEPIQWPILDSTADQRGQVLVRAVFTRNVDWSNSQYKNLFNALLGPRGAGALAAESQAVREVLAHNGTLRVLAASLSGDDRLVITDGREVVLVSKRQAGIGAWDNPPGALVLGLFLRSEGSRYPLTSLRDSSASALRAARVPVGAAPTPRPSAGSVPRQDPRAKGLRIVTYNLRLGGRQRHWDALRGSVLPDLALLQESRPPRAILGEEVELLNAYSAVWQHVSGRAWGSGIIARCTDIRAAPVPGFEGWVTAARSDASPWTHPAGQPLVIVSLHSPTRPKAHGRTDYVSEVDRILDQLRPVAAGCQLILGGDFNFLSLGQRQNGEGLRTLPAEERVVARLRDEFGLISCWTALHPQEPLAQTLRWGANSKTPYHSDGIFIPVAWLERLESCEVLDGTPWPSLSDHSPVVARLR